ncbi:hypothetical protein BGZ46_009076 [Entomortierella lignicola]|nr:hypothetical protein BGZ46_009076 [Entomortierella lignicola]
MNKGFKKHLPGLRHYSQGTEETSRPKPSIHPPARSVSRSQNLPTKSTLGTDQSDINSSNSDTQSQTQRTGSPSASVTPTIPIAFVRSNMASTSSSTTTSSRNNEDSEENSSPPPSSSSSSPSPSSSSTPSTPTSASGRSGSATSNTVFGTRSSTSTLLISTTQEFNQIWAQTTAFLYRTFSPTYRLGNLYIESWTNGTQVRGFERLRTSLLRGDPFALLHNMTGRLQGLWRRSIAEAAEIERKLRAMEKSKSGQGKAREAKPANTSSSNKSNNSNGGGENNNNNNTSSSNSNGSSNSESRK